VSRTARLIRRAGTLVMTAVLALPTAACVGGDDVDLPPPASPVDGPGTPGPTDPTHQAILDTYYGSVAAMVAAHEAIDPDHPELKRYYIERTPALETIQRVINRHGPHGAHYSGDLVVVSATVTDVDLESTPALATIEACLDDTNFTLVFEADGAPVPSTEPGGRYSVTATALLGTDGNWYIVEFTSHWDEPC
jgi:hypothetical protein